MTVLYISSGLFIFAFLLFLVIGFSMQKEHKISRNVFIKAPIQQVWSAVTDIIRHIEWRTDLQKIELKESIDGNMVWVEIPKEGRASTQRVINFQEDKLFETEVLPTSIYHGSAAIEFSHSSAGTTLRITESLSVDNPLKRPFAKIASKLEKAANQYQKDLKSYLEISADS